jgi:hypothetical protein
LEIYLHDLVARALPFLRLDADLLAADEDTKPNLLFRIIGARDELLFTSVVIVTRLVISVEVVECLHSKPHAYLELVLVKVWLLSRVQPCIIPSEVKE